MKVAFGCDHAGWHLKEAVMNYLAARSVAVEDFGTDSGESVDYPDFARVVADAVAAGKFDFGILICGTGLGMAITANKIRGIRAVTVSEPVSAKMARAHNDANIIAFGARIVGPEIAAAILDAFLDTPFEAGRHSRRVGKMMALEG